MMWSYHVYCNSILCNWLRFNDILSIVRNNICHWNGYKEIKIIIIVTIRNNYYDDSQK